MSTARTLHLVPRPHIGPDPRRCAQHVGDLILSARNLDGRPLEEVAPLAGLTVDEWLELEAGGAADFCWETILLIRQVLRCDATWMAYVAKFYKAAQSQ